MTSMFENKNGQEVAAADSEKTCNEPTYKILKTYK